MSIGEDRVRTKFNPSANGLVDQIKQKTAELINLCDSMRAPAGTGNPEMTRCADRAMLKYEEASEAAVKAATA
jgi:hypothetical protein